MFPANKGLNDQPIKKETPAAWRSIRSHLREHSTVGDARQIAVDMNELFNAGDPRVREYSGSHTQSQTPVSADAWGSGPMYQGRLLELRDRPGFILAPRALSERLQLELAHVSLQTYCQPPHKTNVDAHLHREKQPKLAWASVGYNFNWTQRTYEECSKSPFPPELAALTAKFARAAGYSDFGAEAAIINYYRQLGNMGAHIDDSEDDATQPVVSISLGLPCVFLVGTSNREEAPVPVLLQSGDVMMLSGQSRLCWHGVGCVLADENLPRNKGGKKKARAVAVPVAADAKEPIHAIDVNPNAEHCLFPSHGAAIVTPTGTATATDTGVGAGAGAGAGAENRVVSVPTELATFDDEHRDAALAFLKQHRINLNCRKVLHPGHTRLMEA